MAHVSTIVLSVQGVLMTGVGLFAFLDPEGFVAGTSDRIEGKPTQLLHSLSMMGLTLGTIFLVVASHPPIHPRVLASGIILRVTAAAVFWRDGPATRNVALYEMFWAVVNAVAIRYSRGVLRP